MGAMNFKFGPTQEDKDREDLLIVLQYILNSTPNVPPRIRKALKRLQNFAANLDSGFHF